jgi:hypothetical protein
MQTETAIIIAGIVLVFAVFIVVLAWADFYTRNYRAPGAKYFPVDIIELTLPGK